LSHHTDCGQVCYGRVCEFVSGFAKGYAATSWVCFAGIRKRGFFPVEIAVLRVAQINMIEKWNFLNFRNWGEIEVFLVSSHRHVCFWAINEC